MSTALTAAAVTSAAVCTGLAGGVYLAFSAMVLPALRSATPETAVTAMQRINTAAVRPAFMTVFFGAALSSAAVLALAITTDGVRSPATIAGACLSLAGFAITVAFHQPRNGALGRLHPDSGADLQQGTRLLRQWGYGNHLRAAASVGGMVALLL